jgi:predicted CopG family antitoxin
VKTKTIRVEEDVYQELEKLRDWKESYSHVICRLLKVFGTISEVSAHLGPGHYLQNVERHQANAKKAFHQ